MYQKSQSRPREVCPFIFKAIPRPSQYCVPSRNSLAYGMHRVGRMKGSKVSSLFPINAIAGVLDTLLVRAAIESVGKRPLTWLRSHILCTWLIEDTYSTI